VSERVGGLKMELSFQMRKHPAIKFTTTRIQLLLKPEQNIAKVQESKSLYSFGRSCNLISIAGGIRAFAGS